VELERIVYKPKTSKTIVTFTAKTNMMTTINSLASRYGSSPASKPTSIYSTLEIIGALALSQSQEPELCEGGMRTAHQHQNIHN
jgi:hypothetical protein